MMELQPLTDFGFTDEHELLRQTARRLLLERSPFDRVRKVVETDPGFDRDLWQEMAAQGWTGLVLPEAYGGAGLGWLHMALLCEELGRALVPGPFLSTTLAGIAIDLAGSDEQRKRWLPAIAEGKLVATLGLTEPEASWEPDAVEATADARDGGYVLSGEKTHVMWASDAGLIVAPFRAGNDIALFAVELGSTAIEIDPEVCVDHTRRTGRVSFDGIKVGAGARLASGGLAAIKALHTRGHLLLAAEMVGGAEAVLGMTRDYAVERHQFDRPIGSFQAVKHPIVDTMIGVELARTLVYGAADALDRAPERAEAPARMAKAMASDAYHYAVKKGIQLHGGFGFTWDCNVHFYFKRAMWSRATLGDPAHHRRHLAALLLD